MAVNFKIGDRIFWHTTHGGYAESYSGVRTIVRETKSCFVTDKEEYVRKDTGSERGWNDPYSDNKPFFILRSLRVCFIIDTWLRLLLISLRRLSFSLCPMRSSSS